MISAQRLACGNSSVGNRADNDYYGTDPKAVVRLYDVLHEDGIEVGHDSFLEPCVGGGNISREVERLWRPGRTRYIDIVDRGYPGTEAMDFLTADISERYDLIVTNPPYSLAYDFIVKCRGLLGEHGMLASFMKIQYWEGQSRQHDFLSSPPGMCYPFSSRVHTWKDGIDPSSRAERTRTTMCHAWFCWFGPGVALPERGYCRIRPV